MIPVWLQVLMVVVIALNTLLLGYIAYLTYLFHRSLRRMNKVLKQVTPGELKGIAQVEDTMEDEYEFDEGDFHE